MRISQVDQLPQDVRDLLAAHRAWAAQHSPPEDVHALDASALDDPQLALFAARTDDGSLLGVGGLRQLDARHGEIKAMHTVAGGRGSGTGRAVLAHLLAVATSVGTTGSASRPAPWRPSRQLGRCTRRPASCPARRSVGIGSARTASA